MPNFYISKKYIMGIYLNIWSTFFLWIAFYVSAFFQVLKNLAALSSVSIIFIEESAVSSLVLILANGPNHFFFFLSAFKIFVFCLWLLIYLFFIISFIFDSVLDVFDHVEKLSTFFPSNINYVLFFFFWPLPSETVFIGYVECV